MATLLTRLRSLIWPSDPRRYCLSHKLVPEPCAVGLDEPRRRMWKMDRQNIFAGPGDLDEKLSPRPRGLRRIPVEDRRPIGLATLQGVVHEVADHDRVPACCPRERILTQQWWGEWPGVGTSQNVSSS